VLFVGAPSGAEQDNTHETGAAGEVTGRLARTIKVNGLPTRAAELVGQLMVVYFGPEDVALAGGPPAGRRRYLDLANSQVAPLYLRALQQYNRVLAQRNLVLRQVRERRQSLAALEPWTDQLVRTGVFILRHRLRMLAMIGERARGTFAELTGASQGFQLAYRSTVCNVFAPPSPSVDSGELADRYRGRLEQLAAREVEQAVSLVGPHRDDFAFLLDGVDLHTYGSRGQQRVAVLALKLAEAAWMRAETGETPVLLLDDVLSELDPARRHYVLDRITPARDEAGADGPRQVWITTTELDSFPADFLAAAQRFNIDAGAARPA
jgi:DNA replication and repair protein RecF